MLTTKSQTSIADAPSSIEVGPSIADVTVLVVTIECLDVRKADAWLSQVQQFTSSGVHVALDFAAVQLLDSAGLGAVVAAVRNARETGGELSLFNVGPNVRVLFELVRLHQLIDIYNDSEELRLAVEVA